MLSNKAQEKYLTKRASPDYEALSLDYRLVVPPSQACAGSPPFDIQRRKPSGFVGVGHLGSMSR